VWIKRLRLENWMVYRGVVELLLSPVAYAIHAEMDGDSDRSNFLGKTAIGEAILFATHGYLSPTRHFDAKDSWISHGEDRGLVEVEFDDGSIARREKKMGKPGTFQWRSSQAGSWSAKDEAQLAAGRAIGLSLADMMATSFAVQKEVGFLARSRGSELDDVFGEWLGLGRLDRAEARLSRAAEGEGSRRSELEGRLAVDRQLAGSDAEHEAASAAHLEAVLARKEAAGERKVLQERLRIAQQSAAEVSKLVQVDRIQAEGVELRARYEAMDPERRRVELKEAGASLFEMRSTEEKVAGERRRLTEYAKGNFDGQCPVSREACPVAEEVRAKKARFLQLEKEAIASCASWGVERNRQEERHAHAVKQARESDALAERLQTMREQAEKIYASVADMPEEPEDVAALRIELEAAEAKERAAMEKVVMFDAMLAQARRAREAILKSAPAVEASKRRESILSVGAMVISRARREILKSALLEIQDSANADLVDLGADLAVEARWERDGRDPARSCRYCGLAFPASARVKECACGAARGQQQVQRVEMRMTARSGGAEDLAGLVLQLAAGRWLRRERGSGWEVAWLDEAVSSLDGAHRRMVAQKLPALLARAGMRQALIVSHDRKSMEALPGRILVTSDGKWSKAMVVA
jgi:hypothetical protein